MKLLEALIGIFELPEDDALPDGEHFIEVDDTGEIPKQVCDVIKVTRVINVMSCLSTPQTSLVFSFYKLLGIGCKHLNKCHQKIMPPKCGSFEH